MKKKFEQMITDNKSEQQRWDRRNKKRVGGVGVKVGKWMRRAGSDKNKTKESLVLQHVRSSYCSGHSCHPAVPFERRIILEYSE